MISQTEVELRLVQQELEFAKSKLVQIERGVNTLLERESSNRERIAVLEAQLQAPKNKLVPVTTGAAGGGLIMAIIELIKALR